MGKNEDKWPGKAKKLKKQLSWQLVKHVKLHSLTYSRLKSGTLWQCLISTEDLDRCIRTTPAMEGRKVPVSDSTVELAFPKHIVVKR